MTHVRRLTIGYTLSLAAVAALLLIGQALVQSHLSRQAHDASLVNVAGRQRMLSQRVCMHALALGNDTASDKPGHLAALARDADAWESAQRALHDDKELIGGTSAETASSYARVDGHHRAMLDAAHRIVADPNDLAGPTKVLLEHQDDFLLGMDDIVSAYDRDAGQRVAHVSSVERALLGAALLTLFLEGLLVFAPLVRGVRRAFAVLTRTQSALEASLVEQKQLDLKIIETADRERRKLGEDLHDGLCQHLVGVSYLLRAVKPAAEGDAGKRLEEATGLVEEAVDQARHLAKGLHPVGVDQYGLPAALEELGEAVETTFGLPCDVQCDTLEGIQPDVATQLFRIAQEAVANAAKHASAKHLEVSARRRNGELWLEIADDGVGLDPNAKRNMGLYTMSSRASMIGASFAIEAQDGGGTIVRCTLPMTPAPGAT